jgi:DNA-binding NarL/FixJ family response regulator
VDAAAPIVSRRSDKPVDGAGPYALAGTAGGPAGVPSTDVRVLVVDDQEPFRRAMAAVVEVTEGFVVAGIAASGEESLTATADLRPDLVLMDVHLPGIDGIEATRAIRRLSPPPVVVLLSTYDEDEFDHSGCGAAAYVPKGVFGPERLTEEWAAATAEGSIAG